MKNETNTGSLNTKEIIVKFMQLLNGCVGIYTLGLVDHVAGMLAVGLMH